MSLNLLLEFIPVHQMFFLFNSVVSVFHDRDII